MTQKILFLDTETGGIDPDESSLLSIGLVSWDNGEITDSREIRIKHEVFKISPQAIATNKIDLIDFVKKSVSPNMAVEELMDFLNNNFKNCWGKIVIGGHNTNFDINFLKKFLICQKLKFESIFTHRFIDTASILKFLYFAGKLPQDVSSSDAAFRYFNIHIDKRHSALEDALGTARLFTELLNIVRV